MTPYEVYEYFPSNLPIHDPESEHTLLTLDTTIFDLPPLQRRCTNAGTEPTKLSHQMVPVSTLEK